jgi:hypothetical protein
VRRGLPVRPVAKRDPELADPMHIEAALRTVENEVLKVAFEIGLHLQQLQAEHLGVRHERIGAPYAYREHLVDQVVGLGGLVDDDVDGMLEAVSLSACHDSSPYPVGGCIWVAHTWS